MIKLSFICYRKLKEVFETYLCRYFADIYGAENVDMAMSMLTTFIVKVKLVALELDDIVRSFKDLKTHCPLTSKLLKLE